MQELKLPPKIKKKLDEFVARLNDIYRANLISIIAYGSAVSNEYVDKHSNVNLLIVLDKLSLQELKRSSCAVNKLSFVRPVFLDRHYIDTSTDIFPIEFLDMKENYLLLSGIDVLKDLQVDLKHLRYQCEQELKSKLINLSQSYVKFNNNHVMLRGLLIKTFISMTHISRNLIRLKGRVVPYRKDEVIKALNAEFGVDIKVCEDLLWARQNQERLNAPRTEELFSAFVAELEKLVDAVDKMQ